MHKVAIYKYVKYEYIIYIKLSRERYVYIVESKNLTFGFEVEFRIKKILHYALKTSFSVKLMQRLRDKNFFIYITI